MSRLLCRFSAAGNDDLTTRSGGRRLKSAKARNRGGGWYDESAAGYGDLDTVRAVAIRFEREHNLNVAARMLLYGDLMFVLSVISTT